MKPGEARNRRSDALRRPTRAWPRRPPPPQGAPAAPGGFADVRFTGTAGEAALTGLQEHLPGRRPEGSSERLRILALSGGGAGGAFGAGALVGLSRAGARPVFDMVTGVSTGALIAPLAFLGADWDERLTSAYTDGRAADLFDVRGLRPGPGLYSSGPLMRLVGDYVDAELISAVAARHARGARLFVATADLDAQRLSIWDMGAIAARRSEGAMQLFVDVLVASASLPGLFPPKLIPVVSEGRPFEEMHVDGGAITPLFVVPEPLILRKAEAWAMTGVEVYALINAPLTATPEPTPVSALAVLTRSFEVFLRASYRGALRSVAAFCALNGFPLRVGSIPSGARASLLDFEPSALRDLFAQGERLAETGELWQDAAAVGASSAAHAGGPRSRD